MVEVEHYCIRTKLSKFTAMAKRSELLVTRERHVVSGYIRGGRVKAASVDLERPISQRHTQLDGPRAVQERAVGMELPSAREIELETLLRQRDAQIADLTVRCVQITHAWPCLLGLRLRLFRRGIPA